MQNTGGIVFLVVVPNKKLSMKNVQPKNKLVYMESVESGLLTGKVIEMPNHPEKTNPQKTIPLKLNPGSLLMPVEPTGYIKVKKHDHL